MRVLIISSYRCGGNTFLYWISQELNLKYICEPYNKDINPIFPNIYPWLPGCLDNIVVKMPYQHFEFIYDVDKFINSYDKVVILIREDVRSACESFVLCKHLFNKYIDNYYVDDEFVKKHEEEINSNIDDYKKINDEIKKLNVVQTTYENIYVNKNDINKILDYLEITNPKYLELLDYKYKYRKDNEEDVKNINVFKKKFRLI